jgi:hypothetical protein
LRNKTSQTEVEWSMPKIYAVIFALNLCLLAAGCARKPDPFDYYPSGYAEPPNYIGLDGELHSNPKYNPPVYPRKTDSGRGGGGNGGGGRGGSN